MIPRANRKVGSAAALIVLMILPSISCSAQIRGDIGGPHDPAHADRALDWCAAHLARKELVAALSDCDHALARDPKSAAALSNRASVWILAGEEKRALVDIEAALVLTPDDPSLYYNRGLANARLGDRRKAIEDYSEAIRRKPDFAVAYHNRGYEHERLGQAEAAIFDYRRALAITPELKPAEEALRRNLSGRL